MTPIARPADRARMMSTGERSLRRVGTDRPFGRRVDEPTRPSRQTRTGSSSGLPRDRRSSARCPSRLDGAKRMTADRRGVASSLRIGVTSVSPGGDTDVTHNRTDDPMDEGPIQWMRIAIWTSNAIDRVRGRGDRTEDPAGDGTEPAIGVGVHAGGREGLTVPQLVRRTPIRRRCAPSPGRRRGQRHLRAGCLSVPGIHAPPWGTCGRGRAAAVD